MTPKNVRYITFIGEADTFTSPGKAFPGGAGRRVCSDRKGQAMSDLTSIDKILATMRAVAEAPAAYVAAWKEKTGNKAFGIFPMNFPVELVHGAGALPVIVQESRTPVTLGRSILFEFYCGYTRSIADQAATGEFACYDGFLLVDHCVALLGAADAMRFQLPDVPVYLAQFPASMDEDMSRTVTAEKIAELRQEIERLTGIAVTDDALRDSIRLYNRNRQLQRQLYALRKSGAIRLPASQIQTIVKSAMIMDIAEHNALLEELLSLLSASGCGAAAPVRLHLSGHFCHAPRPEILEMIEGCGADIVDDDLYTGFRHISTDVDDSVDPATALMRWYFKRNVNVPCSTRAQKDADWEVYLANAVRDSGADGVIILMAKFCEPHMLYFPEIRKELNRQEIPFLLIETEHEGLAIEMLKTRVEALVERIRRPAFGLRQPA